MTGLASEKMGIKEGARAYLLNAPAEALKAIDTSGLDVATRLTGQFDYIHLFIKSQEEFNTMFSRLKSHLRPTGMLWVFMAEKSETGN